MSKKRGEKEESLEQIVLKQGWGETKLKTDQRVLARITDGIYREPASALRELIFNAYDADATNVWIQTDAPRFHQITVADDGNGMSLEVLVYVVQHIGGSAKRTKIGSELGIAQATDPKLSSGGRRMIGKIGIGLFAVAQLT
ncbi:MAG: ATP-binding protein, partial [Pirellula sp.]